MSDNNDWPFLYQDALPPPQEQKPQVSLTELVNQYVGKDPWGQLAQQLAAGDRHQNHGSYGYPHQPAFPPRMQDIYDIPHAAPVRIWASAKILERNAPAKAVFAWGPSTAWRYDGLKPGEATVLFERREMQATGDRFWLIRPATPEDRAALEGFARDWENRPRERHLLVDAGSYSVMLSNEDADVVYVVSADDRRYLLFPGDRLSVLKGASVSWRVQGPVTGPTTPQHYYHPSREAVVLGISRGVVNTDGVFGVNTISSGRVPSHEQTPLTWPSVTTSVTSNSSYGAT